MPDELDSRTTGKCDVGYDERGGETTYDFHGIDAVGGLAADPQIGLELQ
jgi:hypothetical protein